MNITKKRDPRAMARCVPGDRARITHKDYEGKIVVVVRAYRSGAVVSDATWPDGACPWIVCSLSGPLAIMHKRGGQETFERDSATTIVFEDRHLEPLRDDDDGIVKEEVARNPKPRRSASKVEAC